MIAVDIRSRRLLFGQTGRLSCHALNIGIQRKLCIIDTDIAVIVDIAAQICLLRRYGLACSHGCL